MSSSKAWMSHCDGKFGLNTTFTSGEVTAVLVQGPCQTQPSKSCFHGLSEPSQQLPRLQIPALGKHALPRVPHPGRVWPPGVLPPHKERLPGVSLARLVERHRRFKPTSFPDRSEGLRLLSWRQVVAPDLYPGLWLEGHLH